MCLPLELQVALNKAVISVISEAGNELPSDFKVSFTDFPVLMQWLTVVSLYLVEQLLP